MERPDLRQQSWHAKLSALQAPFSFCVLAPYSSLLSDFILRLIQDLNTFFLPQIGL